MKIAILIQTIPTCAVRFILAHLKRIGLVAKLRAATIQLMIRSTGLSHVAQIGLLKRGKRRLLGHDISNVQRVIV